MFTTTTGTSPHSFFQLSSFKYATPFNYEMACQFVHLNSIKDELLQALEIQVKNGDCNYASSSSLWSWSKTRVDEIREHFKKIHLSKHEATLMYLSRLYELKPMWWSRIGLSQLEQFNQIVDEMATEMKSKILEIVQSGTIHSSQLVQDSNAPIGLHQEDYLTKLPNLEKKIVKVIPQVISKKLEPSTKEVFTMDELTMFVETDCNVKLSDLSLIISGIDNVVVNYERSYDFVEEFSKYSKKKLWKSTFKLDLQGKFKISLKFCGNEIFKEEKAFKHRKLSLSNSVNKMIWNKKCKVSDDCLVVIPCIDNSINHNICQVLEIESLNAYVKVANNELKCLVSKVENNIHIQFKSPLIGNAELIINYEEQSVKIPFIIEYKNVDWSKTKLFSSENVEIQQDSKWKIRENSSIHMLFHLYDHHNIPIDQFDIQSLKAKLENQTGHSVDIPIEFISAKSSLSISFIAPSNIGFSYLSFVNSKTNFTLQKFTIEIIKARTYQISIVDQKNGIGQLLGDKLKEKAMKQSVNLNIQASCQKPDVVLRFIYHNGPPTWSDFKPILSREHENNEGSSVIMVLATLNKEIWKKDSPDENFPSGVNLYQSDTSIRKRGVVWILYDYNYSIGAIENESEIMNLIELIKKVK